MRAATTAELVWGLSQAGWEATAAVAATLAAIATIISLVFIAKQLQLAQRHQADGVIERGSSGMSKFRSELFEFRAMVRLRKKFGFDEMRRVRDVFFAYESYVPVFELQAKVKGLAEINSSWYIDDLQHLVDLLTYIQKQSSEQISLFRADAKKILDILLDKLNVADDDRQRCHELLGDDVPSQEFNEFLETLVRNEKIKKGASASALAKEATEKDPAAPRRELNVEQFRALGGDVENLDSLRSWVDETTAMIGQMQKISNRVKAASERAK